MDNDKRRRNLLRRVERAKRFMENTCPASRHLHMIAKALAKGQKYHMLDEEPQHCAETMLSVLESLWALRTETKWPSDKHKRKWERSSRRLRAAHGAHEESGR